MAELPPTDIGLAQLQIDDAPDHVIGAPIHVAIVVRANHPGATIHQLPPVDWSAMRGAIGLEVRHHETGELLHQLPVSAQVDADRDDPSYTLYAGESRRMLVDLSEYLDGTVVGSKEEVETPRQYVLRLTYGSTTIHARSAPFTLSLRPATGVERSTLDVIEPERQALGSWGAWTGSSSSGHIPRADLRQGPPSLWFAAVARSLMFTPHAASLEDLSLVDTLAAFYAPEQQVLKMEVLGALHGRGHLEAEAAKFVLQHREMDHRIRAIEEGEGWLRWRP